MSRPCGRCGQPLDDEHHDAVRRGPLESFPLAGWHEGKRVNLSYVRRPRKVLYACRLQLTADTEDGSTFTPHTPQRGAQEGSIHPVGHPTTSYRRKELLNA